MATLYDDDDPFDANGMLKDGRRVRISMQMRDAALRDQRRGRRVKYDPAGRLVSWEEEELDDGMTLHDGRGNPCGHRPGYLVTNDAAARSAKARAYRDYESDLTNAWRNPTGDAEGYDPEDIGESCTVKNEDYPTDFGSPGTIRRVGSRILCVPNRRRAGPDPASDRRAVDDAYRQYDDEIRNAWRDPK